MSLDVGFYLGKTKYVCLSNNLRLLSYNIHRNISSKLCYLSKNIAKAIDDHHKICIAIEQLININSYHAALPYNCRASAPMERVHAALRIRSLEVRLSEFYEMRLYNFCTKS